MDDDTDMISDDVPLNTSLASVKKAGFGKSKNLNNEIKLSDKEFRLIADLVYKRFGINLTDKKKALVKGRLYSLISGRQFKSFKEYFEYVTNDKSGKALLSLIDRISTNHSYFFRESDHFDILTEKIIPDILHDTNLKITRELRIWSAGCAFGEESYTIAMVLYDYFFNSYSKLRYNVDVGILGTDISISALNRAKTGIYSENRIGNIPKRYKKYFISKGTDNTKNRNGLNGEGEYQVDKKIKSMILFKRLNLMRNSYPFKGKFHIIFCRNVMIYFDRITKKELTERFYRYLYPGGYLVIGHSESLGKETGRFCYIQPTIYKKC